MALILSNGSKYPDVKRNQKCTLRPAAIIAAVPAIINKALQRRYWERLKNIFILFSRNRMKATKDGEGIALLLNAQIFTN